ncbi:hypothetical protein FB567DRAFT_589466 [Paraphoma chrysanthemicola]|uniref:Uncharacterized protein n=1 Tax=Paraphoma chrysanthemicola TaxID=798071 RepID=A0A8K0RCW3_9PLEO|nr:hypothetical protein FB567DRAFT_589466 [Paraphoma chrysanthemicola]
MWVGRGSVNAGPLVGAELYKSVYRAIDKEYHGTGNVKECSSGSSPDTISTKAVTRRTSVDKDGNRKVDGGIVVDASIRVLVQGKWSSDKTREIMVNVAAKALEQLTYSTRTTATQSLVKASSVTLRIWVELRGGGSNTFDFQCCKTKDKVSDKSGDLSGPIKDAHGKLLTKEVRCFIYGLQTCEQCGSKCDSCTKSPCA